MPTKPQLKKREAMERVVELYATGLSATQCMQAVGRTFRTWVDWKQVPWFAARIDAIRTMGPKSNGRHRGAKPSFVQFRKSMFGFDTFWHQQQIVDAIEGAKGGEITMILLPPEWGKSTVLEDLICYTLGVDDPNHRFCLISESATQAKKMLNRIQRRMTNEGSPFCDAYGPFKATGRDEQKAWNDHACTILAFTHDERDFSIEARGALSKLYGSRYDTVLLDDIQSRQTINTTLKLLEFIRGDLLTRPGKAGRIVFVGTRVGDGDVAEAMLEAEMIDKLVLIPALDEDGHSMFPPPLDKEGNRKTDVRGVPLGWTEEELAQRRAKVGEDMWAQVYMQQPRSKVGAPFTEDTIKKMLDYSHCIGNNPPGPGVIATIDPALQGWASIKVGSYTATNLYLLDNAEIQAPGRFEELFDAMEAFTRRWHPAEWVMETNAMQGGLARDDRLREMSEKYGFRIIEHTTGQNKVDPLIGVASMADAARRGEIHLPYGDDASVRQMAVLLKQLRQWRPDIPTRMLRQDSVMALWFLYRRWKQVRDLLEKAVREINIGGMPWAPTGLPDLRMQRKTKVPA